MLENNFEKIRKEDCERHFSDLVMSHVLDSGRPSAIFARKPPTPTPSSDQAPSVQTMCRSTKCILACGIISSLLFGGFFAGIFVWNVVFQQVFHEAIRDNIVLDGPVRFLSPPAN
jgi:hypothetical protein